MEVVEAQQVRRAAAARARRSRGASPRAAVRAVERRRAVRAAELCPGAPLQLHPRGGARRSEAQTLHRTARRTAAGHPHPLSAGCFSRLGSAAPLATPASCSMAQRAAPACCAGCCCCVCICGHRGAAAGTSCLLDETARQLFCARRGSGGSARAAPKLASSAPPRVRGAARRRAACGVQERRSTAASGRAQHEHRRRRRRGAETATHGSSSSAQGAASTAAGPVSLSQHGTRSRAQSIKVLALVRLRCEDQTQKHAVSAESLLGQAQAASSRAGSRRRSEASSVVRDSGIRQAAASPRTTSHLAEEPLVHCATRLRAQTQPAVDVAVACAARELHGRSAGVLCGASSAWRFQLQRRKQHADAPRRGGDIRFHTCASCCCRWGALLLARRSTACPTLSMPDWSSGSGGRRRDSLCVLLRLCVSAA
jgi:hypothetical protein